MILFWTICALLLIVAVLFVVLPLWRSAVNNKQVVRDAANLEIFRDQVDEMGADLRNGLLTQELYDQGERELQARMLDEVKDPSGADAQLTRDPHKLLSLVLAAMIPLLALGVYLKLGNPDAMLPPAMQANVALPEGGSLVAVVQELEARVAKDPTDMDSQMLLGRFYAEMKRYPDAVKVYEKLSKTMPGEAQVWADFAGVLAMQSGGNFSGRPTEAISKALQLDPKNPKALALAGSAALVRGDFTATLRYWETLIKVLPPGSEERKMVEGGVKQIRERMAQGNAGQPMAMLATPGTASAQAHPRAAGGKEGISGRVTLNAALRDKAKPDDLVFVLARAAQGPKMPLAVLRKQVKDLPFDFTLDDSLAMSPQIKLSDFDQVLVVARISTSGNPVAQAGDMEGVSQPLKPGSGGVKLSIDSIVK